MAYADYTASTPAQQPGLKPFIVYDEVPGGCTVIEIDCDDGLPHLRKGDFAVVDTTDRQAMHGEMFIIRWGSGHLARLAPIAMKRVERKTIYKAAPDQQFWNAIYSNSMFAIDGSARQRCHWYDGPYPTETIEAKLIGKVVGVYQPEFRAMMNVAA